MREISSSITVVASVVTLTSRNTPPKRPTGVRSGSQIRASRIPRQLSCQSRLTLTPHEALPSPI